jgi:hypothetical protein
MFQYAFALNMADRLQTELKMDLGFFQTPQDPLVTPRNYELCVWQIPAQPASAAELKLFLNPQKKIFKRLFPGDTGTQFRVIKEKQFRFDPALLNLGGNLYLDGYWQSEQYFSRIKEKIQRLFSLHTTLDETNARLEKTILNCESVAIHVRRMDYLKTPEILAFHGVMDVDYYQKAFAIFRDKFPDLKLFVFSDDPDWSAQNLKYDVPVTHINHNRKENSYLDLWLMSRCKHQIIANSSFGWWAAWLNPNANKTVIAPRKWFAGSTPDTADLIPNSWTCL